jgi:hypothetical protein
MVMKIQSFAVSLAVAALLGLAGCQGSTASSAPQPSTPTAGDDGVVATRPDAEKEKKHLREHVTYPATRADVLAACASTPEFTAGEKKWAAQTIPDRTFASADDLIAAIGI